MALDWSLRRQIPASGLWLKLVANQGGYDKSESELNSILALRSCVFSGRYEDYWAYRSGQTPPVSKI